MKHLVTRTLPALAAVSLFAPLAGAAVNYITPGATYTQDFDRAAGAAATSAWANDSTIPGWYAYQSSGATAPTQVRATNGTSTGITLYLFRIDANATDHAFGTKPVDASGSLAMGLALQNTTGQTLTSFTLGYTGEQWVDHNTTNQNLVVAYQTFTTPPGRRDARHRHLDHDPLP